MCGSTERLLICLLLIGLTIPLGRPLAATQELYARDGWMIHSTENAIDDSVFVTLATASEQRTPLPHHARYVVMGFRCHRQTVSVFWNFDLYLDSKFAEVRLRVDKGDSWTAALETRNGGTAIGYWTTAKANEFVRHISTGSRLALQVQPYREGPITLTFDMTGFREAYSALYRHCQRHWKGPPRGN